MFYACFFAWSHFSLFTDLSGFVFYCIFVSSEHHRSIVFFSGAQSSIGLGVPMPLLSSLEEQMGMILREQKRVEEMEQKQAREKPQPM